jgi:putative transposase
MDDLFFKNKYRVPSARLPEYDYSKDGFYFVTICTKDMICCLGDVVGLDNDDFYVKLSEIGEISEKFWLEIPKYFNNVKLDIYVIMPNHIHGIIVIGDPLKDDNFDKCRDAIYRVSEKTANNRDAIYRVSTGGITKKMNPMLSKSLSRIIRWYKERSTYEIRKSDHKNFAWQERFYDRVIRDENELNRIRQYIIDNPAKWELDKDNPDNL